MAQQSKTSELEKEITKTKNRLRALEQRLLKQQLETLGKTEEERIEKVEKQLRKKYPDVKIDRDFLSIIGKLPRNVPPSEDHENVRRILAERYG